MRQPRPFLRRDRQLWYVQLDGRQINLGSDAKVAFESYHKLMANRQEPATQINRLAPVVLLLDEYLVWCEANRAKQTYEWYYGYLKSFADHIGQRRRTVDLRPHHVTDWVDRRYRGLGDTTKHNAVRALKRAFNWGVKQGYLDQSPIKSVESPTPQPRETYIEPEAWQRLMAYVDEKCTPTTRDLLVIMRETGCRPKEARILSAQHIEKDCLVLSRNESKGRRDRRVIPLTAKAQEIVTRLAKENPDGPLLRNAEGRPWTSNAVNLLFDRLSKAIELHIVPYSVRHTFATDALVRGVDVITVARIMGHTDLRMLNRVYAHVSLKGDHLREAMKKATGSESPEG